MTGDRPHGPGDHGSPSRRQLGAEEARVLGCLLEKERTTPDDYPLTANAVMRAANQSTSRDPVVAYDVGLIERVAVELKAAGLLRFVHSQSNRSTRYRHVLDSAWELDDAELSLLCLLMLRGPQTPGELRSRADRLHGFASVDEVASTLRRLADRAEPFVVELDRQPGHKEARWAHLVGGPVVTTSGGPTARTRGDEARRVEPAASRIEALEVEVERLSVVVRRLCDELGVDPGDWGPGPQIPADAVGTVTPGS